MLQQAPVLSRSLEEDEMGFLEEDGLASDCLAHRSGFQFAKARFVGGSCITSRAGGFRAYDISLVL